MITDYYALQIDNPMNVLSQDMARQFLHSSSPGEKYKLFVKGVQLEQLDQDYQLMEESIDRIDAKLVVRREEMVALGVQKEKARSKLALSDRHAGLRDKVRNIRGQMAWAQVEEQERVSLISFPERHLQRGHLGLFIYMIRFATHMMTV